MVETVFSDMKRYVSFTEEDVRNVCSLAEEARGQFSSVVERFYEQLFRHEKAKAVFTGGAAQIERQRRFLAEWLEEVFAGEYGEEYYQKRLRIGQAHVRVGLPQHYMFTAMQIVWQELARLLAQDSSERRRAALRSLHKVLVLDLAIMLESYKESYSEHVRQLERTAVEAQLTRAEHLAEIGQLAASLAHEIKNPLAGISGAMQVLRDELPEEDPHRPILTEVLAQINRVDATVKDLLLYARPAPPRNKEVVLNNVVQSVLSVLREEPAMHQVKIRFEGAERDARLIGDENQLEHLFINLLLNAAHASPRDGLIRICVNHADGRVRVSVEDTGIGMPPEVQARAFEAFYTTKAKGTGLGLSICKRIVEAHGGAINLQSDLGRGTTVTVDLPKHGVAATSPLP